VDEAAGRQPVGSAATQANAALEIDMSVTELADDVHDEHASHAHGEFIAHHFDSAEQQYDSGKLGIWLFLVTEILFFSGLFCAYTLYRAHHPEIFVEASTFLDKRLGGINTIVLLFSSLTMALAVRYAQLVDRRKVIINLIITMVCAAIFLGIKAVEYSHKWDEGIWVRAFFSLHEHAAGGISKWLVLMSIPFLLLLVASVIIALAMRAKGNANMFVFFLGLAIMFAGYFLGAIGGKIYMNWNSAQQAAATAAIAGEDHQAEGDKAHTETGDSHAEPAHSDAAEPTTTPVAAPASTAPEETGVVHGPIQPRNQDIGIFFSIYYCMTGLHAFHVLGGMVALSWLLYRSVLGHWRADYFGPVDFVGLYWHLVDLIWIFLFPLLYLIN
jgi:cytochrome c oxidase subunit 3